MDFLHLLCQIQAVPESAPTRQQEFEMLKSLPLDEFIDKIVKMMVSFTIDLCVAFIVFFIGKFVIGKIYNLLASVFVRRKVDPSLATFLLSLIRILLYFVLIITVIGILGIETSSFIALFASASVAISLAFTGTLQNFAGGVLILLLKPYKVGDYVEVGGYAGTVREIQIFSTVITTSDNKSIIIPNGGLSTGSINNYSREEYRRVDWTIGISYGDDVNKARQVIIDLLLADDRVVRKYIEDDTCPENDKDCEEEKKLLAAQSAPKGFKRWFGSRKKISNAIDDMENKSKQTLAQIHPKVDRSPVVYVSALADSSVNLTVRAWTRNSDYWGVYFKMNELFYNTLPEHGINFPFPQMDVHLDKNANS